MKNLKYKGVFRNMSNIYDGDLVTYIINGWGCCEREIKDNQQECLIMNL